MADKPIDYAALYDRLLKVNLADRPNAQALEIIGTLIDVSDHLGRTEGAHKALECANQLDSRNVENAGVALLEYFRANAWAVLQSHETADPWDWEHRFLGKQIYHLRKCIAHPDFAQLEEIRRCQVFTNLGNQMDTVGRFVEALDYWEQAIALRPSFGMAVGNRGRGLEAYARSLYDHGHKMLFLKFAYSSLTAALSPDAEYEGPYPQALAYFGELRKQIEEHVSDLDDIKLHDHGMGETPDEQEYRRWCLRHKLFLNPLNDLGPHSIANRDILMLPSFFTKADEPPTLVGFFNQLKQEYASARWLLYQGSQADSVHLSDRGVRLYNTLDYSSHCFAVEQTKIAFRMTYSLLDKLAFFLNDYLQLGMTDRDIYFKTIWYQHRGAKPFPLRPQFKNLDNWPFRGLFWLAKDLFDEQFSDVIEPDAREFYVIRNRLEHSYVRVHEGLLTDTPPGLEIFSSRLAYSITRDDLKAKTLRLFKLVRAAMIYLMLGMHREEVRKAKEDKKPSLPMHIALWEDDWKR